MDIELLKRFEGHNVVLLLVGQKWEDSKAVLITEVHESYILTREENIAAMIDPDMIVAVGFEGE